eukprot:TRINITY_DN9463_c0_g1_i4.p1 TRINITY_DN9463_c0_g1~~TRINITY_DN9463_c0_g1_i4.p1  ORF type:complete len:358 (+),score=75.41 TRINITY_DN9463_c0_g1_i4:512-1585(+)
MFQHIGDQLQLDLNREIECLGIVLCALQYQPYIDWRKDAYPENPSSKLGYEQLLLVGESILKLAVSTHIYCILPTFNEHELHDARKMFLQKRTISSILENLDLAHLIPESLISSTEHTPKHQPPTTASSLRGKAQKLKRLFALFNDPSEMNSPKNIAQAFIGALTVLSDRDTLIRRQQVCKCPCGFDIFDGILHEQMYPSEENFRKDMEALYYKDCKNELQQFIQSRGYSPPTYETIPLEEVDPVLLDELAKQDLGHSTSKKSRQFSQDLSPSDKFNSYHETSPHSRSARKRNQNATEDVTPSSKRNHPQAFQDLKIVYVYAGTQHLGTGIGNSVAQAEKAAARDALDFLLDESGEK